MTYSDDLEPIPAGGEQHPAEGHPSRGARFRQLVAYGALLLAGFVVGFVARGDGEQFTDLRSEVRSLRTSLDRPATIRQIDVRGPLVVANPCPVRLDATLRDDTGRPRWGGELAPGVTIVEQLAAITVSSEWSLDFALPGGHTSMELGDWLRAGTVTIPALSCPAS